MSDEQPEHELAMPFVSVTSKGGPYDDGAYAAGYEMGMLDATLGGLYTFGVVCRNVRVDSRCQADLIAMRHGWRSRWYDASDGWIGVEFVRIDDRIDVAQPESWKDPR